MGYENAKIYKLVNDTLDLTYYGCTINSLRKRLWHHKRSHNKCTSKILFEGEGQVKIFLVEEYPTDNRDLLNMRERWYIENNDCVNKNLPGRSKKEWRKQYIEINKEHLKEYQNEYNEKNKEKIKEYRVKNKEKINEYRQRKTKCVCGSEYQLYKKNRHEKSEKHILYCSLNNIC